jgi:hypothetical protein
MSSSPVQVLQVFKFDSTEEIFDFSDDFRRIFSAANNPFIIMFIGNGRVGKSTRLNQILTKEIDGEEPFKSLGGTAAVTTKFQFYGPLKSAQLGQIHGLDLSVKSDPDVFLIDCEGLHSLGETTPELKKATFALAQMSSLTVLVMKEMLNHQNLDSVRSLFALTRAFSRDIPGFLSATAFIQRDVGVPCSKPASFEEKNELRMKNDSSQKSTFLALLNSGNPMFSEQLFATFSQPSFIDPVPAFRSRPNY